MPKTSSNPPLIAVDNLSVDFRGGGRVTHAVRNVSFDIGKAETVALVG
jgi:microcin C transport system ATP-binding protein